VTFAVAVANAQDAALTAERGEIKYFVPLAQLPDLTAGLNERLPPHRFRGDGANTLPRPLHFVTTVYFDTPGRVQFRAARKHRARTTPLPATAKV
jgi:hypothetical protein